MNLPAIVEATLEGLGILRHIGSTSYDNTKTASDTIFKPCFGSIRKKGKEYDNKTDREETDEEYVAYVEAVKGRNVLLTKYAKDDNDVDITDALDDDFKLQIGCVRELNLDQAELWLEEIREKSGKAWKKIVIDCYWTHSEEGMKKVQSFIDHILDKESTSDRKAKQAVLTVKRDSYQQLMEDPSSEKSAELAQALLEKVAIGTMTHKEAVMEAMDN